MDDQDVLPQDGDGAESFRTLEQQVNASELAGGREGEAAKLRKRMLQFVHQLKRPFADRQTRSREAAARTNNGQAIVEIY